MQQNHKPATTYKNWQAGVEDFIQRSGMPRQYPIVVDVIPAVAGLPVKLVTGCPHCPVTMSASGVKRHIREAHEQQGGQPIPNITIQAFHRGSSSTYFRVLVVEEVAAAPMADNSVLNEVMSFDWRQNLQTATSGPQVSPFLNRTKWHIMTMGFERPTLREIAQLPRDDDGQLLQAIVKKYYEQATASISKLDELSQQILNTADPDKTFVLSLSLTHLVN